MAKIKLNIGDPIITVNNLRKVYRVGTEKIIALNTISFTINKGEVCCLLGTSGSGKSTLLNMMAGLEKPTKGTVEICKEMVDKMNEKNLAIFRQDYFGFVFQSYNLLTQLTALENVSMPLVFKGYDNKKRISKSLKILDAVGLKERAKHKPTQMSGGQQQRVGIARAFVSNPEIVFADEPTGNLDTKTTYEVMNMMVKLTKDKGKTLIIVTHDLEVAQYADKVIHIRDGNIESITVGEKNNNVEVPMEVSKIYGENTNEQAIDVDIEKEKTKKENKTVDIASKTNTNQSKQGE